MVRVESWMLAAVWSVFLCQLIPCTSCLQWEDYILVQREREREYIPYSPQLLLFSLHLTQSQHLPLTPATVATFSPFHDF